MNNTIVAIGEGFSIQSTGYVMDHHSYTWPFLLENTCAKPTPVKVKRFPMNTALEVLEFLEYDLISLLDPMTVFICLGTSDSHLQENSQPLTDLAEFSDQISKIITVSKSKNIPLVFVTPTPLPNAYKGYMEQPVYQSDGINFMLLKYVQCLKENALDARLPVIDLFEIFSQQKDWQELIQESGKAPNRAGNRLIADIVNDYFKDNINLDSTGSSSLTTIVTLGDSVTNACNGIPWRTILEKQLLKSGINAIVHNAGIPCDRTVQGAARFEVDALARNPDYVTICFGLNDAWITPIEEPIISEDLYEQKLIEIVEKTRQVRAIPILVSPNPFTRVYNCQRKFYDEHGINGRLDQLLARMRKIAESKQVDMIDINSIFKQRPEWNDDDNPLVADGSHPSALGNEVWAEQMIKYFKNKLI